MVWLIMIKITIRYIYIFRQRKKKTTLAKNCKALEDNNNNKTREKNNFRGIFFFDSTMHKYQASNVDMNILAVECKITNKIKKNCATKSHPNQ